MDCLRCHKPTGRKAQAKFCAPCAVAERNKRRAVGFVPETVVSCLRCKKSYERRLQSKYCVECLPLIHRESHPKEKFRRESPKKEWRGLEYLGFKPKDSDWIRLAAYIDGEGSINLTPRPTDTGSTLTLCGKVVVTNTDPRLSKWCLETFGMKVSWRRGTIKDPRAVNWKPCYVAQACAYKAAWILQNCLPWFLLKREQAQVVLDHQETTQVGTWARGKGVKTPQDILQYRKSLKEKLTELNKRGPELKIKGV